MSSKSSDAATKPLRDPLLKRDPSERELIAQRIADRLDGPITALGVIFLLVVLAQTTIRENESLAQAFEIAGWLLWAVFVIEFLARLVVAPSTGQFLKRNWWQAVFLVVPFLRFLRVVRALRAARAGRIIASAVRSARTARQSLTGRLGWLSAATMIVILAASQLLREFSEFETYGAALHATSLAVISGEPMQQDDTFAQIAELVLALYSVVVFAALAGMLGAYFLERRREVESQEPASMQA